MKTNKTNKTITIFTYGTLMKNQHNNKVLGSKARYICDGSIYNYINIGLTYDFPCIVPCKAYNAVIGEVWEVDINDLPNIDMLEGYDIDCIENSMYIREVIQVCNKNNLDYPEDINCYVYVWNSNYKIDIDHIVPSGHKWNEFNIY